ncbi:hypothetical protein FH972_021738 [Carpinus fangiana]|uniref:GDT1 family protein n=1 Tax=Carpinus fangiana TaxID=176857 RepID=A0A5N6KQR6_9ROSI|nr:hypothetical protein FH972_021738 [Carpinus fangiana]
MKLATAPWPFLLLALSSFQVATSSAEPISADGLSSPAALARDTEGLDRLVKYDVGTKDAPVDGKDGKPHAGPFVDPLPYKDSKSTQASPSKINDGDKPTSEDSVMNDPTRQAPKKGTTGTEGGVSEKERNRKAQDASGETRLKKPEPPKEPQPEHAEEGMKLVDTSKTRGADGSTTGDSSRDDPTDKKSAPGLKKPENLPDTPHQIPHPDPPSGSSKDRVISKPLKLLDDSDDEDFAADSAGMVPWDALMGSFSSIAASEIGDKTFIVAALMAMRHPRLQVFTAAFSALFVMTILSAVTGHAVGSLISKSWAAVLAALLFLVFGIKSIKEGMDMDPDQGVGEEMREVQAELEEKEVDMARSARRRASSISPYALESGRVPRSRSRSGIKRSPSDSPSGSPKKHGPSIPGSVAGIKNLLGLILSPAWVETFSMTFIGELGDRSQIATVAMAAGQEYFWVMVGATLGHFLCTGVAVVGGSVLAGRITMRKGTHNARRVAALLDSRACRRKSPEAQPQFTDVCITTDILQSKANVSIIIPNWAHWRGFLARFLPPPGHAKPKTTMNDGHALIV